MPKTGAIAVIALLLVAASVSSSGLALAQQPPPPGPGQPLSPLGQPPLPPAGQPPATPIETDPSQETSSINLLLWALGGLFALGVVAMLLRARSPEASPPPQVPRGAERRSPENFDDLLEVGRRLTAATSAGDIERAVVREAIGLVPANAAAIVRVEGEHLVVAHESTAELLRPEGLTDGVVGHVAATGQPVVQISATEPSIRYLPVSLIAIPLVGAGRVDAVLVMVRGTTSSFTPNERERLVALAPVAAAAIQSSRSAEENTLVDGLTGVGNRSRLDKELPRVIAAAEGGATAIIMVDLDHFKAVIDTHGHPAGDALLRGVGEILRDTVRPSDAVYRYGGEEFCVVLPRTDTATAASVAERIRVAIDGHPFDVGTGEPVPATASLGVASATGSRAEELIAKADQALYAAKHRGRNRVVTEG